MNAALQRLARGLMGLLLVCMATGNAWAHKGSDAYLNISDQPNDPQHVSLTCAVAIKDLALVLSVDANGDGNVTWGEIKAATPAISALLAANIAIADAPALVWQFDGLESRGDGAYVRLKAALPQGMSQPAALALRYALFATQDATHRLLVAGQLDGKDLLLTVSPTQTQATVLRAGEVVGVAAGGAAATENATAPPHSAWRSLTQYFGLGVHHLLEGYDHLAFLLALVLPLQLRLWPRQTSTGEGVSPSEWGRLLATITAFTLGHSITLVLATLGYTSASPAWVEPVIAVSVGVSALLNIYPQRWLRTEVLAGAFGLVHGYGFAGLLTEAAAPSGLLGWALGGFNLGVEAGQLIAVTAWVIVAQPLVGKPFYARWVLRLGSWLLVMLSAFWVVERVI